MSGKHIEMFLVDGTPGGLTTCEIAGWTGHILSGRRSDLARAQERHEPKRNGTYILWGEDPTATENIRVYIGKTENFIQRFNSHHRKKEFWDSFVIISAKDDGFSEGHWGYLEARLCEEVRKAQRCTLENQNQPMPRRLSEAHQSDVESFLRYVAVLLPIIGLNILRARKKYIRDEEPTRAVESPVFFFKGSGLHATMQVVDGEVFLLEGSEVAPSWRGADTVKGHSGTYYESIKHDREKLFAEGAITRQGSKAITTRDIRVSSASRAGTYVVACGFTRKSWKWDDNGVIRSYNDWLECGIEQGVDAND